MAYHVCVATRFCDVSSASTLPPRPLSRFLSVALLGGGADGGRVAPSRQNHSSEVGGDFFGNTALECGLPSFLL